MSGQASDLLLESAPLARRLAPSTCYRDAAGESCAWSHGLWQYLRLLDLIATPQDHGALYREALGEFARPGRPPRILVSGAADYGMLAEVIAALRPRGVEPEVVVLDLCETPLVLNRWYAERIGCRIATVRSDMLDYTDEQPFDAVCTHSFFGRIAPQRRPALIDAWRRLLRPGGMVVTVNRLRAQAGAARNAFEPGHVEKFRDLVLRAAREAQGRLGIDPEILAREAEAYARRPGGHSVRSREELEALFEGGGLRLERFSAAPLERATAAELRGPTLPGGALYASLVARRP